MIRFLAETCSSNTFGWPDAVALSVLAVAAAVTVIGIIWAVNR